MKNTNHVCQRFYFPKIFLYQQKYQNFDKSSNCPFYPPHDNMGQNKCQMWILRAEIHTWAKNNVFWTHKFCHKLQILKIQISQLLLPNSVDFFVTRFRNENGEKNSTLFFHQEVEKMKWQYKFETCENRSWVFSISAHKICLGPIVFDLWLGIFYFWKIFDICV